MRRGLHPRSILGVRLGAHRIVLAAALLAGGLLTLAKIAYADPHAVFYTDRGQEQLFFNVLAALNQADYVEEPSQPGLRAIKEMGDQIARGLPIDFSGRTLLPAGSPEPNERIVLPRLRVRQVTSDDGDVFFREELWRRAEENATKVAVAQSVRCPILRTLYGDEAVKAVCPRASPSPSPSPGGG